MGEAFGWVRKSYDARYQDNAFLTAWSMTDTHKFNVSKNTGFIYDVP